MQRLAADLRFAIRALRKAPLFTAVAVLSIAFGIAANSAVFTLVDQVVLRNLPVPDPKQIVQVDANGTESYGGGMGDGTELSYAMYKDLRDRNQVFSGMLCRFPATLNITHKGFSERVQAELVSGTYFSVLGVTPVTGRVFTSEEDRTVGDHPVIVLGYEFWKSHYNGDRGVIGQTLTVSGQPFQIVGVSAPEFQGVDLGFKPAIYVPITMQPKLGPSWLKIDDRRFRWVQVFARLKDGMTRERAAAGLAPLYHSLLEREEKEAAFANATSETRRKFLEGSLTVTSAARGHSNLRDSVSKPLLILMAIAAGVLLIVSANVANLLIARGAARDRELALRLAIGANRGQIIRLLLVESFLLAALGTLVGLVLATWGAGMMLQFYASPDNPISVASDPDFRIVLVTAALAIVTALIAGSVPAWRGSRVDVAPALRSGGSGVVREQPALRKTLVVAQVALSFLLLIGSGLFLRSLRNLLDVDTGYRSSHLVSFSVDLARSGYDANRAHEFARNVRERLLRIPGVQSTAGAFFGVLEGGGWGMGFTIEGYHPAPGQSAGSMVNAVSPDFFRTMGVPLLYGRDFDARDERSAERPKSWPYRAAIVNETFVNRYFQGHNPLGRHIGIGEDPGTPTLAEVIGVVKDTHYTAVREKVQPQVFLPYMEAEIEGLTMYVRATADTKNTIASIRHELASMDPSLPLFNVSSLDDRIARSLVNDRLIASLSAVLSTMATLLAVIGLYGLMTYTVTRRTHEIGIRVALGAMRAQIAGSVLREAAILVVGGLLIGGLASIWLGRYIESELYGVKPADGQTILFAAAALGLTAFISALLPARRAASVSPMTALRQE